MRAIALALAALALTGCATKGVFLLADGRIPADDPLLKAQLEKDLTICNGEAQKANLSGNLANVSSISRYSAVAQVGRGCMAEKGYVLVRKEDVETKQKELQAATSEKTRLEATAAARRTSAAKSAAGPKSEQAPASQAQ